MFQCFIFPLPPTLPLCPHQTILRFCPLTAAAVHLVARFSPCDSQDYCFHNGMHFLTSHASFNLWLERNLQRIDPKVSLAQWDFMLDAARLGTAWGSSEIFGPDMFGSASGSPEKNYQISDGWFADITSVYDPNSELLSGSESIISTNHNPYGFVDASFNYQVRSGVSVVHRSQLPRR